MPSVRKRLRREGVHYLELSALIFKLYLFVELDPVINQLKFFVCLEVSEDGGAVRTAKRYPFDVTISWLIRNRHLSNLPLFLLLFPHPHLLLPFSIVFLIYSPLLLRFPLDLLIELILLLDLYRIPLSLNQIHFLLLLLLVVMPIKPTYVITIFNQHVTIPFK